MSADLLTVQLTERQARALHSAASMFSQAVSELNPEWASTPEDEPSALASALLTLEMTLVCASES
jgi:cell division protein ZapA (FtsZ GTPase activity inhibitor)